MSVVEKIDTGFTIHNPSFANFSNSGKLFVCAGFKNLDIYKTTGDNGNDLHPVDDKWKKICSFGFHFDIVSATVSNDDRFMLIEGEIGVFVVNIETATIVKVVDINGNINVFSPVWIDNEHFAVATTEAIYICDKSNTLNFREMGNAYQFDIMKYDPSTDMIVAGVSSRNGRKQPALVWYKVERIGSIINLKDGREHVTELGIPGSIFFELQVAKGLVVATTTDKSTRRNEERVHNDKIYIVTSERPYLLRTGVKNQTVNILLHNDAEYIELTGRTSDFGRIYHIANLTAPPTSINTTQPDSSGITVKHPRNLYDVLIRIIPPERDCGIFIMYRRPQHAHAA